MDLSVEKFWTDPNTEMKLPDTSKIENKIRNGLYNARTKNYDILKNLPAGE